VDDRPKGKLPEEALLREWLRRLGLPDEAVAGRALAELHRGCRAALCTQAEKLVGSGDDAQDVVAETSAALWESRDRLKVRASAGSYLRTALRNRGTRWRKRSERVMPLPPGRSEAEASTTGVSLRVEQAVYASELEEVVEVALSELPECQREVVAMRVRGYSHADIAKELGISQNAVGLRLRKAHAALQELREHLQRELEAG